MLQDATVLQSSGLRLAGSGAAYREALCEMLDEAELFAGSVAATIPG